MKSNQDYLDELALYCQLHNSDDKKDYQELVDRFEDFSFSELLEKLPPHFVWTGGRKFDSPGYDVYVYAVAWIEDGKPVVEQFDVEYF